MGHSSNRAIIIFADNTDASEDFRHAIDMAQSRPWKPLPAGANHATTPQERYSEEETDRLILAYLKRAATHLHVGPSVIIP